MYIQPKYLSCTITTVKTIAVHENTFSNNIKIF